MGQERNSTLDLLKLLAAYMVVFIHVLFYGKIGVAAETLARFAVPLFFWTSGFYSYRVAPAKVKRRIGRLLRLLVYSGLVYMLYHVGGNLLQQDMQEVGRYFAQYTSVEKLFKLLIFNVPIHTTHLWYLFASVYVYSIFYFVTGQEKRERFLFAVSLVCLIVHLVLGEGLSMLGIKVDIPLVRNFALFGIPFFGLGLLTRKYKARFPRLSIGWIAALMVIGAVESLLSRYFFGKNELFVGALLILFAFVALFIKYPDVKVPQVLMRLAGCSTYIYILHPMVAAVMVKVYALWGLNPKEAILLGMAHPLLVCFVSTFVALAVDKVIVLINHDT